MSNEKPVYGGQAVVEGVMFGGKNHTVTAVRRNDGSIEYFHLPRTIRPALQTMKKIPLLRGIVAILEAAATGSKHLNFANDRYDVLPGEEEAKAEEPSKFTLMFGVALVGILSFLFGKFVFTLVPVGLAELTRPVFQSDMAQILVEGLFKLLLLLVYIWAISMTPLIKRVFQYHGAEHKVINAYENGLSLTVQNVQASSRLHYRCGSSFILFTVIVGVFVYMLVPTEPFYVRVLNRLALIPVVLGLSFEVLQLTNKVRDVPGLKWLGYPGLCLQLLTTKDPSDDQVEVAIASFKKLISIEESTEKGLKADEIV
ncbi:DUF1385 domain-containing protein [Domibacillus sp. PGB-M46]|uniref:DUF1385 domain-containing protein n=1 Tax=Domibacillus sp. PGB-M46 TaxID=2910255 RepID=UPI001F586704|nr:DUF1385 domain-containing protein [Domibacillus sp. PGB-M46]MCI2254573.1 DUF1385 domain-containing protein [Domibacillus sp. PGB-M46]